MKSYTRMVPCAMLCCGMALVPCIAQEEMKWGKLSDEELSMKVYENDPEADAVVLGDYGVVEFDIRSDERPMRTDRHVRIKYLTQEGIESHGDVEIRYQTYQRDEALIGLKAHVLLPNGTKVDVGKDHIFTEKENEFWTVEKISFPALEPGAVAEYRYTITSRLLFSPIDWYFQGSIPVIRSDLRVKIPDWFDYVILKQGRPLDREKTAAQKDVLTGMSTQRSGDWNVSQNTTAGKLEVSVNTAHYVGENVPALRTERHITTMNDYYSRIRYQLRTIRYPNAPIRPIMQSWSKVEEELLQLEWFGKQYLARRHGEAILALAGVSQSGSQAQTELASRLFDALCMHLTWNKTYSFGTTSNLGDVIKTRAGSTGDLNLALLAGLLELGIDAAPVLTSTRSHGQVLELYPFMDQFNHVIVRAHLDGKPVLLDVAGAYQPLGLIRENALNYRGWIVQQGQSQWIDVLPELSRSTIYYQLKCDPSGELQGTLQARVSGYPALRERILYHSKPDGYLAEVAGNFGPSLRLSELQMQAPEDKNANWTYTCNVSYTAQVASDYIYISPMFPAELKENPFKAEDRTFPVEFNYPYSLKYVFDFVVPEGYLIESIPESRRVEAEDGGISFTYRCGESSGKIQVTTDVSVTNMKYVFDQYSMLKLIFNEIVSATGEQIVLKRAT